MNIIFEVGFRLDAGLNLIITLEVVIVLAFLLRNQ